MIQKNLHQQQKPQKGEKSKIFAKLFLEGKINAAIWLLADDTSSGILPLSVEVIRQKDLDIKPSNDTMLYEPFNNVNEIIFDGVNGDSVRKCAIRTKGSHGPSGLDANFWSTSIDRLVAGQLIPFDKSPGVRPFGVGEVLRQIIGKAILTVLKSVLK